MLSTKTRLCLLPLAFALGACTLVLPPDEKDDGVERCDNSAECADPGDNRLTALCYSPDDLTQNAPGVCITEYNADINCDPTNTINTIDPADWPQWVEMYDSADPAAYAGCQEADYGKRGCTPLMGGCEMGLEVDEVDGQTICVDPNASSTTLPASVNRAGQDVQHAFCRAFFGCDSAFVCDQSIGKCVPCDPAAGPDDGGCVEMWVNGAASTAYDGLTCNEGSTNAGDIMVGAPPVAP